MEAERVSTTFDPLIAASYGAFIATAYQMHAADPANPMPRPLPPPKGFTFIAWVQMKNFFISSSDWSFYGLLAKDIDHPDRFVLAIRGTASPEEWWGDLTSMVPAPWSGPGLVGYGFNRIYQTLRIVEFSSSSMASGGGVSSYAGQSASFAEQVAATIRRHSATSQLAESPIGAETKVENKIVVAAHSLGAALATLYVAENASIAANSGPDDVKVYTLCTFASPRVGDRPFARAFDALPLISWRVVNELDIVPKLPAVGFEHVDLEQSYNSGSMVRLSLTCWHALSTYLHLLDPKLPLDTDCTSFFARAEVSSELKKKITNESAHSPEPSNLRSVSIYFS